MSDEMSGRGGTYVLMLDVFQQLEFAIGAFAEDGCAKGFHDLLYRHGGLCELVLCGTWMHERWRAAGGGYPYQTRPKAPGGGIVSEGDGDRVI